MLIKASLIHPAKRSLWISLLSLAVCNWLLHPPLLIFPMLLVTTLKYCSLAVPPSSAVHECKFSIEEGPTVPITMFLMGTKTNGFCSSCICTRNRKNKLLRDRGGVVEDPTEKLAICYGVALCSHSSVSEMQQVVMATSM